MYFDTKIAISQKMAGVKVALFDFDGTLVNLEQLNYDAFNRITQDYLDRELERSLYLDVAAGMKSRVGIEQIFKKYAPEKPFDIDEIQQRFRGYKREALQSSPERFSELVLGTESFLKLLKESGVRIGIVSSSAKEFIKRLISFYGIGQYFEQIIASEDVTLSKPNPQPFEIGIRHFKARPEEVIAFEDSRNGIRSAKSAGLYVVGILNQGWNDHYVFQMADIVVDDYREVVEALK